MTILPSSEGSSDLLLEACALFDLDPRAMHPLGGYESRVYEVHRAGTTCILRLTRSRCRSRDEIAAELEWVAFLHRAGLPVAKPALEPLKAMNALNTGDGQVTAVLFERAPGRPFRPEDWSPRTALRWGELLAAMHALARDYVPPRPPHRRHWRDDVRFQAEKYVPAGERDFYRAWRRVCARLAELPSDPAHYGLIHADVGPENMSLEDPDGAITLFDFADSIYSWFAHDLACSICEARHYCRAAGIDLPSWFTPALFEGYRRRQHLERDWEEWLDDFLELQELERTIARYRVIHD
jgi:Ser/Thr protein kinase RdoA (MazF antagonist)